MTESAKPKPKTGWLNILVDYGPLLVFLGVYKFYQPPETSTFGEIAAVIYGTIAFMIAAVAALLDAGAMHPVQLQLSGLPDAFQQYSGPYYRVEAPPERRLSFGRPVYRSGGRRLSLIHISEPTRPY